MSGEKVTIVSGKIVCPNHGCPLEGLGFPIPKKGVGMCPISGASFEYEAEGDEQKMQIGKDKNGRMIKIAPYIITGTE